MSDLSVVKKELIKIVHTNLHDPREVGMWIKFCQYATDKQANDVVVAIKEKSENLPILTHELKARVIDTK